MVIRGKKDERCVRRGQANGQAGVICPGSFVGFVTRLSEYKKGGDRKERKRKIGILYALHARWQVPTK